MALHSFVGPWCFFNLLILYTFGRTHWTGDQPVARLYLHREQHKHRINSHTHITNSYDMRIHPSYHCYIVKYIDFWSCWVLEMGLTFTDFFTRSGRGVKVYSNIPCGPCHNPWLTGDRCKKMIHEKTKRHFEVHHNFFFVVMEIVANNLTRIYKNKFITSVSTRDLCRYSASTAEFQTMVREILRVLNWKICRPSKINIIIIASSLN
jgi:hypothetical protein